MTLADYPGFPELQPDLQALLLRVADGDEAARPALLRRAADVLNVFIGLELLQYVFIPPPAPSPADRSGVVVDLIVPEAPEPDAVAWFTVGEAGYDEFRDAVTLFGDLAGVLNPPIVLEADDDDAGGDEPAAESP